MKLQDVDSPDSLLARWHKRVRESQFYHYERCNRLHNLNLWLGIPAVCLSAVVGKTVFASLKNNVGDLYKIVTGMMSISVALLASVQTFLKFSEKSEKHRIAAVKYGALRREVEQFHVFEHQSQETATFLDHVRKCMD